MDGFQLLLAGAILGALIALPVNSLLQSPVDNLLSNGHRTLIGISRGQDLRGKWHVEYEIEGRTEKFDIKLKQIGSRVWGDTTETDPSRFFFKLQGRFVGSVLVLNWIDADSNGISHGVFLGTLDPGRKGTVGAQWLGFDRNNTIQGGKIVWNKVV